MRYIEWSRCTSRSQEVNNIREDSDLRVWKTDSTGAIKAVHGPDMQAVLSTELDLHNCTTYYYEYVWHTRSRRPCHSRCRCRKR